MYTIKKALGKYYIFQFNNLQEQRSNTTAGEGRNAASYPGYKKWEFPVSCRELAELVYIRADGVRASVLSGYRVALSLQAVACAPGGSEVLECCAGGSSTMHPRKVGPEDKYFIFCKMCDVVRCKSSVVHSAVLSDVQRILCR